MLFYGFRTPFPRILDVKKWFQKVLSARRNASWKNLAVFSPSCEKICLSGTRSMNFLVQMLFYGFRTPFTRILDVLNKNDFKRFCLLGEMLLWKILLCFQSIVKNLPFRSSKYELFGTNAFLWIQDSIYKDTERKKMISKGSFCAEKCFLEKSCCVLEALWKKNLSFRNSKSGLLGQIFFYEFIAPVLRILKLKQWF